MSKRFTDTQKWEDPWFRKLSAQNKLFWLFLCDRSDLAGVWKIDMELAEMYVGGAVDLEAALSVFNANKMRVSRITNDRLHLVGFVAFQYGELSPESRPHRAVLEVLKKHKIKGLKGIDTLSIGYPKGYLTLKDKDKDKDKDNITITNKLATELPKKDRTPLQKCVRGWKALTGHPLDDRGWDALNWARTAKSAKQLIEYFDGNITMVLDCMESIYSNLKELKLECTIETIVKRAADWRLANGYKYAGNSEKALA